MRRELSSQQALEYTFERVHRIPRNKSMESRIKNHTQVAQEKSAWGSAAIVGIGGTPFTVEDKDDDSS
jgi:hypothetical protein